MKTPMNKILKIGMFDWPESRWDDSKDVFEKVILFQADENFNEQYNWVDRFPLSKNNTLRKSINKYFFILLEQLIGYSSLYKIIIRLMRLLNCNTLKHISSLDFDYVYSGYNDYDKSDHLTVLIYPYIKRKFIVRAVKETRPNFRYPEFFSLKKANLKVFNSIYHQEFFRSKYHLDFHPSLIDLDEDYRPKKFYESFKRGNKFSKTHNTIHIVILSGRVFSDTSNSRSGARQYYIDLIKECVNLGYRVDLFTGEIKEDINGINQYEILEQNSKGLFQIMGTLDLRNNPSESYTILSSYDYGILHNYVKGADVSIFDNVNLPNRIYEYLIAGVVPIVPKGQSIVIEELFEKHKVGYVYSDLEELKKFQDDNKSDFKPSFFQYLQEIDSKVSEYIIKHNSN